MNLRSCWEIDGVCCAQEEHKGAPRRNLETIKARRTGVR